MKPTEYKTTMRDVATFLLDGPRLAHDIGAHFWPDKCGYGPSHGGPSAVAVSASYLLGRMRIRGFVEQSWPDRRWYLTDEGHAFLRKAS